MELTVLKERIEGLFHKYKYVLLVVFIGIVLIMIPQDKETSEPLTLQDPQTEETSLEDALANILTKIKGAGKVEVMLTVLEGEEILYQENKDISNNGESFDDHTDTVIVNDANRAEDGLIRKVIPPVYKGAIIVCQGADDPAVKLAITEAVSKVTGIGANRISVLKMN